MMEETAESVAGRARRCAEAIERRTGGAVRCEVVPGASVIGGGAAPTAEIPTSLLTVRCGARSPDSLEESLRLGSPPVISRIESDRLVLDLRTVPEDQEEDLVRAVASLAPAPPAR